MIDLISAYREQLMRAEVAVNRVRRSLGGVWALVACIRPPLRLRAERDERLIWVGLFESADAATKYGDHCADELQRAVESAEKHGLSYYTWREAQILMSPRGWGDAEHDSSITFHVLPLGHAAEGDRLLPEPE